MIRIHCRTNLDLAGEKWPEELPSVPRVGDIIQSSTKWGVFQLPLEVYSVTWESKKDYSNRFERDIWIPVIELHIPKYKQWSLVKFYEWYAPLVGRNVSAFI